MGQRFSMHTCRRAQGVVHPSLRFSVQAARHVVWQRCSVGVEALSCAGGEWQCCSHPHTRHCLEQGRGGAVPLTG